MVQHSLNSSSTGGLTTRYACKNDSNDKDLTINETFFWKHNFNRKSYHETTTYFLSIIWYEILRTMKIVNCARTFDVRFKNWIDKIVNWIWIHFRSNFVFKQYTNSVYNIVFSICTEPNYRNVNGGLSAVTNRRRAAPLSCMFFFSYYLCTTFQYIRLEKVIESSKKRSI